MGASNYILHRNFESYKEQKKMYSHINKSDFRGASSEFYNSFETEIPNLTISAMPLKAVKAMYILENESDSIDKAKSLLKKGSIDNPFLMYSEGNLSQVYYAQKMYDSAYYYARKSFIGLPKNAIHFAMIAKLYANKNVIDSIVISYEKIINPSTIGIDRIFLASMNNFYNAIEDSLIKKRALNNIINIKKSHPINVEIQHLADLIIIGKSEFERALILKDEGEILLQNRRFKQGILKYLEALDLRKDNYPYIQTIGLAYYNLAEYNNAIEYLVRLEDNGVPLDPLSLYAVGISYYNVGKQKTGCEYLLKASNYGEETAKVSYMQNCYTK